MDARSLTAGVWTGLGGDTTDLQRLTITGPAQAMPSVFPVTAVATASVAAATLAVARLWRMRGGTEVDPAVAVDSRHAAFACSSERYVRIAGEDLGDVWDPIAGVYAAADGWIRLHTNHRHHRAAALTTLGLDEEAVDRGVVGTAVARRSAVELESAVHDAGGCAAALRSVDEWRSSPPAIAVRQQPLVDVARLADAHLPGPRPTPTGSRPLEGVRVLDMSRVLSGPVAGRFLAAYGAEVLRLDAPPGDNHPILLADTLVGKRSALLDLRDPSCRGRFETLVSEADVVLCGYRPGALDGLGAGPADLAALRPGLVVASVSAYGEDGPWGRRRGFDSLVQMASGIADEGRRATAADKPVPLPAQLLDHATGYLLAAGIATGLTRRHTSGGAWRVRTSLARTAEWLLDAGRNGSLDLAPLPAELPDDVAVDLRGERGRSRHVACPGVIVGAAPAWRTGPVPLGHDEPTW